VRVHGVLFQNRIGDPDYFAVVFLFPEKADRFMVHRVGRRDIPEAQPVKRRPSGEGRGGAGEEYEDFQNFCPSPLFVRREVESILWKHHNGGPGH